MLQIYFTGRQPCLREGKPGSIAVIRKAQSLQKVFHHQGHKGVFHVPGALLHAKEQN